jgi:hypothetical protein
MEPSVIFGSLKLARSIAEFAGLIETLGTKIDRLANAEFKAGFRALEQSAISSSEKDSLLREVRYRFNKAISLEKEERLFLCHVGIAICHKELGDLPNFKISLSEACKVKIVGIDPIELGIGISRIYFGLLSAAFTQEDISKKMLDEMNKISKRNKMIRLTSEQKKIKEYLLTIET